MRKNEVIALEQTVRVLAQRGVAASWIPADDPPDAWLHLCGARRPAEVTRVTHHVRRGGRRWSQRMVYHELTRAAERIAQCLVEDVRVIGEYVLRAQPVPDLKVAERHILAGATEYCRAAAGTPTAPSAPIYGRAWGAQWRIAKVGDRETSLSWTVSLCGMPIDQGHSRRMLKEELAERAAAKSHIPSRHGVGGVLILEDWFHYANDDEWRELLPAELMEQWHTVVRVGGPHGARLLHSRDVAV